ncbi:MAG: hypothetical protein U0U66_14215 [Cytophagaceae bacterium]
MDNKDINNIVAEWKAQNALLSNKIDESKKKIADSKLLLITEEQKSNDNQNKVLGIGPQFYFWMFGVLFVYVFFVHDKVFSKSDDLLMVSNYVLYDKPDNQSEVILQGDSAVEIKIVSETKYYYQVELIKNGSSYLGFLNKKSVSK